MNNVVSNMTPQQPSIPKDNISSGKKSSSEKADDFRRLLGNKSDTQADERPETPKKETIGKNQEEEPPADLEETVSSEVLLNGIQIPAELFGLQDFIMDEQGNRMPVSQEPMVRGVFAVEETVGQMPVAEESAAQVTTDLPLTDAGQNTDMQQEVHSEIGELGKSQNVNAEEQASRLADAAQGHKEQKALRAGGEPVDKRASLGEQGKDGADMAKEAESGSHIKVERHPSGQTDEKRDMNSGDSRTSAGKEDGLAHMRTYSTENTSQTHAPKTTETYGGAGESDLMKQVSEYLDKSVIKGAKELELQLNPKELGKLSIRIAAQDGRTEVTILCSNNKTLKTLSENAGEIGRIMENNLGTPTSIVTEFKEDGSRGYSEQGQENDSSQSFNGGTGEQSGGRSHSEEQNRDGGSFFHQLRLGLVQ